MVTEPVPPKDHWHPYSLQQLTPNELTTVVNDILQGRLGLLPITPADSEDTPADSRGVNARR